MNNVEKYFWSTKDRTSKETFEFENVQYPCKYNKICDNINIARRLKKFVLDIGYNHVDVHEIIGDAYFLSATKTKKEGVHIGSELPEDVPKRSIKERIVKFIVFNPIYGAAVTEVYYEIAEREARAEGVALPKLRIRAINMLPFIVVFAFIILNVIILMMWVTQK